MVCVCVCVLNFSNIVRASDKRLRLVIYDTIFAIFIKLSNWHQKIRNHDEQKSDADFRNGNIVYEYWSLDSMRMAAIK